MATLRHALGELRKVRLVTRYPAFLGSLAQGLGAHGFVAEARNTIEEALAWAAEHEDHWCEPELLRIKGDLLRTGESSAAAEACYKQALEDARRQEAMSWELRIAISLARLWRDVGKKQEADELLSSIYHRFTEGFETRDLRTARALLGSAGP